MIVTRAKAEEAHAILRAHYMGEIAGLPMEFDKLDKPTLTALYHSAARATHPDGGGGDAEAFARVDWAKHVLLKWLDKKPEAAPPGISAPCASCEGKGFVQKQVGFRKGGRMQCSKCHGTGDAAYEPERHSPYSGSG